MPAVALSSSNAPSTEYRQHHQVDAPRVDAREFRPGWRVKTGLDGLRDKGLITGREYRRAVEFRRTYEAAHKGAMSSATWNRAFVDRRCRRTPAPEMTERQAAALARLVEIRAALGALYPLLLLVVIADASWCEIGRRVGIDPRTARRWGAAAIAALAAITD